MTSELCLQVQLNIDQRRNEALQSARADRVCSEVLAGSLIVTMNSSQKNKLAPIDVFKSDLKISFKVQVILK